MTLVRKRRLLLALIVLVSVTSWAMWALGQRPHPPRLLSPPQSSGIGVHRPAPPGPVTRQEEREKERADAEREQPDAMNWTEFGGRSRTGKEQPPPYLAMLINFGILVAGYYLLGKKPIAEALQTRRDTIAKDIEEAHKMLGEAQARAQTYQAKLAKLEEEVQMARAALTQAGEAERERIVAEAEAKAERMRKDVQFQVEQDLKQIRQDLWKETVEAAVSAAEDLLKKRVTMADQERMAEDYLADLGGKKSVAAPALPRETAS